MRYQIEYAAVASVAMVVRVLPIALVRRLGEKLGVMFYVVDRVHRRIALANLQVYRVPAATAQALAACAQRSMQLQATIQEGVLMLGDASRSIDIEPLRWK